MSTIISDLHIHCSLKGFAADNHPTYKNLSIWDYYPKQKEALERLNFALKSSIKSLAKASQANLDACVKANLRVPFLSIYPIERQMYDLDPQKPFRSLFSLLLKGDQHTYLGSAVTGFPPSVVADAIQQVNDSKDEGFDYYPQYLAEIDYLIRQTAIASKQHTDHLFRIANDYDDLQSLLKDDKTIAGLLTVEGAHTFGHYLHHSTFKKEWEELDQEEKFVLRSSFTENLKEIKSKDGGKYAPFFVTFCHHFNNLLAGHARSFSDKSSLALGLNKPGIRHLFNQEPGMNRGFTPLGLEVLELMLDRSTGRRILIDVKHMSIEARQEFYNIIRKKREEEQDHIPIIHSHAAINGWFTLEQAKTKVDDNKLDKDQFFSRWQINLTNEDILETYDSDGIIGVVLHEGRMPGDAFNKAAKKLQKKLNRLNVGSKKHKATERKLKDLYLQLVWSTIFHIIKVVKDNRDKNGWKMIALGSDYDGLVDPLNLFPEVDSFQDLRHELVGYLEANKEIFFAQNGQAQGIPAVEVLELQFGKTPEELLNAILFENTQQFLQKYFHDKYSQTSNMIKPAMQVEAF